MTKEIPDEVKVLLLQDTMCRVQVGETPWPDYSFNHGANGQRDYLRWLVHETLVRCGCRSDPPPYPPGLDDSFLSVTLVDLDIRLDAFLELHQGSQAPAAAQSAQSEQPVDWRLALKVQLKYRDDPLHAVASRGVIIKVSPDGTHGIADKNGVLQVQLLSHGMGIAPPQPTIVITAADRWVTA